MFSIHAKYMFIGVLLLIVGEGLLLLGIDGYAGMGGAALVFRGATICGLSLFLYGLVGKADPNSVSHFTLKAFVVCVGAVLVVGLALVGAGESPFEVRWYKMGLGMILMGWLFVGLLWLARFGLSFGSGLFGVARTVLDEAIRMKVALVFMVWLLIIPVIPELISSDKPVHYRVQTFMSWGIMLLSVQLSLMTIFLACRTLSAEIENKQIYTLAVKPLGRTHLLIGKWLGIVVLNALLLSVGGGAIYGYTVFYLAKMPAINAFDERALHSEVLTARQTVEAEPPEPLVDRVRRKIEQTLREDAGALVDLGRREAEAMGEFGLNKDQWLELGTRRAHFEMLPQVQRQWMSVAPHAEEGYLFTGLGEAKASGVEFVQLRYKVSASGTVHDNFLPVWITANGNRKAERLKLNRYEVLRIPSRMIDDEGKLLVTVKNENPSDPGRTLMTSVIFYPRDGLELLYEAGAFGPNFARGIVGMWVKLSFLAMLGLMSATFLGFPVACLLSLLVFLIASLSPYLVESVDDYITKLDTGVVLGFKEVTGAISLFLAQLLKEYAAIDPKTLVVDGRKYSSGMLLEGAFWVGVCWTLVSGAVAALIFRKRELARVQV